MTKRSDLTIYSLAWTDGDCAVGSAEDAKDGPHQPIASVECIIYLNGEELAGGIAATVKLSSDFTTATIELSPSSLRVVQCDASEWEALKDGREPERI